MNLRSAAIGGGAMTLWVNNRRGTVKVACPLYPGGFNRSTQHEGPDGNK